MSDRAGMNDRSVWEVPPVSTRLVTERLILRAPRTTDVPELRRTLRVNSAHLRPWSTAPAPGEDPHSLTSVSKAVIRQRREWKRGQSFTFFITPRDDDSRILGRVTLGGVLLGGFRNAYLGYWIDGEHQGRGLTTEAVRAATGFAFVTAALHRVQAAVMPSNPASHRVLAKVGYRNEGMATRYLCIAGTWEDHVLYAMTSEEWPQ
jgi:ribosomal-protein-alanine N-acetyltransferase